jgi:hemoglobin
MAAMTDLTLPPDAVVTEDGIRRLLDRFYARVREDPQLGPVFARAIGTTEADWAPHMARLADFWSSVMLRSGRYHGDPFSTHLRLPDLEPRMFDRWLALFDQACVELFPPELAGTFRERAARIAASLRMGLERLPIEARHRGPEAAPPPAAGVSGT